VEKDVEKTLSVLQASGEDAYVLGEVVKSQEGVEIC
jgi:phosphoribosylaminoimidazole (AIR) synthetase